MHAERLMTIYRAATHQGELPEATHQGLAGEPGCGPWMRLRFRVEEQMITQARWETYGCPTAMACAEIVCTMSEGRPLAQLPPVTADDVSLIVGVPEGKEHCPELAVRALNAVTPFSTSAVTGER